MVFIVVDGLCFDYLFSYSSLLELQYRGRIRKSWVARELARETGVSVREAECRVDVGLFLDKYSRWELGTPHQSVVLHKMFLHAAEWGWKEADHRVYQGCQGSTSEPGLEAGHSTMELVGYQTSCKEIRDIYHSVYLLRRPPGLPSCGDQLRRRTICDILSSLTGQLNQCGYPAATGEDLESEKEWLPRSDRRGSYEEALRAAHRRALDTTKVLQGDIERLSRRMRSTSQTHSKSSSKSCTRSQSRSQSRSWSRSCSRAHSQSHPQSASWSRWPRSPDRPPPGRRVTFREPEVEPNPEEGVEDYSLEPPVSDVETWLEWQAGQLGTPTWWSELTAIPGMKDPQKLTHKIWASFYIPKVRMRAFLE